MTALFAVISLAAVPAEYHTSVAPLPDEEILTAELPLDGCLRKSSLVNGFHSPGRAKPPRIWKP